jgi:hypothetical protein
MSRPDTRDCRLDIAIAIAISVEAGPNPVDRGECITPTAICSPAYFATWAGP